MQIIDLRKDKVGARLVLHEGSDEVNASKWEL